MDTITIPLFIVSDIIIKSGTAIVVPGIIVISVLLLISAMVSGAEVAFFSLNNSAIEKLKKLKTQNSGVILKLLEEPEKLLATILIANNFVNIGIIMLTTYVTDSVIDFSDSPKIGFFVQIVCITFLLLLFGEIIPKVYAAHANMKFAKFMALPLMFVSKIFSPISFFLIKSTSIVNRRFTKRSTSQNISVDDLTHALKLAKPGINEDQEILEGIVSFVNTEANDIMKPRIDVITIDISSDYSEVKSVIIESGYSRIPVYQDTFDNIKGVLYTKDLLNHIDMPDNYEWQKHLRDPYFVPETIKINDLLFEFQNNSNHIAIISDEYGGLTGIVTMEDILEEILGEISDESDEDNRLYKKIDSENYIFEAKILINDMCKIIEIDDSFFDSIRGDADSLAGLILEIRGEIPKKDEIIKYDKYSFFILSADSRKINRIKLMITELPGPILV